MIIFKILVALAPIIASLSFTLMAKDSNNHNTEV